MITLALKVDVDTELGTKVGVTNLAKLFKSLAIPATFYFSLGPDNTGRALCRIFRKGFLKKCTKTNVLSLYGWKTLGNGIFWPGPHIGKKHAKLLAKVAEIGFDVGIHAYDHQYWQNNLWKMTPNEFSDEFTKAVELFHQIFGKLPETAAAPGWQANQITLKTYQFFNLLYASDCRGTVPFYPSNGEGGNYPILEIPTTLPTLDEVLVEENNFSRLTQYYLSRLADFNVMTVHAEIEGMHYCTWFNNFLQTLQSQGVRFITLKEVSKGSYDKGEMGLGTLPNRAGELAVQLK